MKTLLLRFFILSIFLIIVCNKPIHCQTVDTIKIWDNEKNGRIWKTIPYADFFTNAFSRSLYSNEKNPPQGKIIYDKNFFTRQGVGTDFLYYFMEGLGLKSKDPCNWIIPTPLLMKCSSFNGISIYDFAINCGMTAKYKFVSGLTFEDCIFNNTETCSISGVEGYIHFNSCKLNLLSLDSFQNSNIHLSENRIDKFLHIYGGKNIYISFERNTFDGDTGFISISGSKLLNASFEGDSAKESIYSFSNDTILGDLTFNNNSGITPVLNGNYTIVFSNCYIDATVNIWPWHGNTAVRFQECTFGTNTILNLIADNLTMNNCNTLGKIRLRTHGHGNKSTILGLSGTDFDNIDFDYLGNLKLYTEGGFGDNDSENFETMLSKLEKDKKKESHKRLSIEYSKYRNCGIVNFLNEWWWYYGYRTEYIVLWTFGFLMVFYAINFCKWEQLNETYPIVSLEPGSYYENKKLRKKLLLKKRVTIFVFTLFIFFSLRIDFSKLSFKRPWMVLYFFVQYFVGLLCLFFIFNSILKL